MAFDFYAIFDSIFVIPAGQKSEEDSALPGGNAAALF
jgi:hypothetical protein